AVEIAFIRISALALRDYCVIVSSADGEFSFARLGNWCQPFYDALCASYNQAVLRSLFVREKPLLAACGDVTVVDGLAGGGAGAGAGMGAAGMAAAKVPIYIFSNCVVSLPPDLGARRVPLCFLDGLEKGDFSLTLRIGATERYSYAKLGYDTDGFAALVEERLRALREESLAVVSQLDPSLTAVQAAQIAKLLPQGAAASYAQLEAIAPSFVAAWEKSLAATRAADYFAALKGLSGTEQVYIGFRQAEAVAEGGRSADGVGAGGAGSAGGGGAGDATDGSDAAGNKPADAAGSPGPRPDAGTFWMIVPSPDKQYATVEFAVADTATFVYRTDGDYDDFVQLLNRALEAIGFHREAIWMADEELLKPENADYCMAAQRTFALQAVRSHFIGRVIHSSVEAWKQRLLQIWSGSLAK
ncbi:MAG: hypothetical protein FWF30_04580, partial [Coriobacteriia bacterium]|nr:hypothetical protein [Coriobacteriia bacterium]